MLDALLAQTGADSLSIAIAIGIVFVAAIVQTSVGMGFGQVAAPALVLLDPRYVPAPVILMAVLVGTFGALRERDGVVVGELAAALTGRAIGAVAAAVLLAIAISRETFSTIFAILTLAAVGTSLARWRVLPTRRALLVAGACSGLMGTITTIGAPPMGIVYQHAASRHARATLNAFFAAGAAISLVALAASGLLGPRDLALAVVLAPGLLAGAWVGRRTTHLVDRRFRPLVLALATCSAVAILVRGFQ